jgi:sulfate adenylyltransferase
MYNLNLNYRQFSDLLNLVNNVYLPLKNFPNEKELIEILSKKKYRKSFFPYPIFFGIGKKIFLKINKKNKLNLIYKKKLIAKIEKINFFFIKKKLVKKYLFTDKLKKHQFNKEYHKIYTFMNFKISKVIKKNFKHKYFISPKKFIETYKINKYKTLAAFHTRNVPHSAHQWIHKFLIKKYQNLLIQPLIGQYKKGEFKDKVILETNKMIAKNYNKKNYVKIFSIPFFSYPRYGGPKEAALHAIVRKNYGCTHFWIGRDHAGLGSFFKKYDSRKYCKKNEKYLGIKIVSKNEPSLCSVCQKISVNKCCKGGNMEKISGTKIRKLIMNNKNIPEKYMIKFISKRLSKNSLI